MMPESPYSPPLVPDPSSIDYDKLQKDLVNAQKGKRYTLILIPIVGFTTAMQYAGNFSAGSLPKWFGFVVIGVCAVQLLFIQYKIKKLEATLEGQ